MQYYLLFILVALIGRAGGADGQELHVKCQGQALFFRLRQPAELTDVHCELPAYHLIKSAYQRLPYN